MTIFIDELLEAVPSKLRLPGKVELCHTLRSSRSSGEATTIRYELSPTNHVEFRPVAGSGGQASDDGKTITFQHRIDGSERRCDPVRLVEGGTGRVVGNARILQKIEATNSLEDSERVTLLT